MPQIKELIEWDFCGTQYSVYIKHFIDDEGRKGMKMIYEDVTNDNVTEMIIPPRCFPSFLRAVNDGAMRQQNSF